VGVDDAFSGSRAHISGRESPYQESPVSVRLLCFL
jgi:hypothetical protein